MSQIIRATTGSPSPRGISRYVSGCGIATMSDSSIALNPVIDEPSKPIPSSSASSTSLGVTAKLFRWPSMSVNQRSRKSTLSSCIRLSASRLASGSLVARCLLSTCAMKTSSKTRKPQAPAAPEAASPTDAVSLPHLSKHPQKRDVAGRRLHGDELLVDKLEARLANELAARIGVEAREEHLDSEPVLDPVRATAVTERREEEAAGLQPSVDPTHESPVLASRHVHQGIQRRHGVERRIRNRQLHEVALDEGRGRRRGARQPKLLLGNVDADDVEAVGEIPRVRAVAAAEIQHPCA